MKLRLAATTLTVSCVLLGAAHAQQSTSEEPREQALNAIVTTIKSDPDPLKRALAAEKALASPDPLTRSVALEAALESNDGRVREQGFIYLVSVQKQMVIHFTIAPDGINPSSLKKALIQFNPFPMAIASFDAQTLTMVLRTPRGVLHGSITQDGISVRVAFGRDNCEIVLRQAQKGSLGGAINCGVESFPADTPLP